MKIGFIGLGIMGKPMAKNLITAGYELVVHNRSAAAVEELKKYGATAQDNPKGVAEHADVIITMLPDSPDVEKVALGPSGIIEGIEAGKILIDMSSISPATSRRIAEQLAQKGAYMLDAPVSGGEKGAIDGTLAIMVGGSKDIFDKVKPILEVMGSTITWVGEIGCGNITKLVNQIMVAVNIAAMSEAMALGIKAGMDPQTVYNAIKNGLAGSKVLDSKIGNVLSKEFKPGFKIDLHIKDLYNAINMGREVNAHLFLTDQVLEMLKVLSDKGYGGEDHSALFRFYTEIL